MWLRAIVLLSLSWSGCAATAPMSGDENFAIRLYGRLAEQPGNVFFSPASIRMALAMAYAGARGETASEMARALSLPAGDAVHAEMAAQLGAWERYEQERIVLRVVNRLWGATQYKFVDGFLALLRDRYRAPLATLDFRRDPEAGRLAINDWVSKQTEEKIRELIGPGGIMPDTRMVITNAVYFKARWREQFHESATREEPFFLDAKKQVRAPLMHQEEHLAIAAFDGGQVLELPYGNGQMVMDIILPREKDGLARVAKQMTKGALPTWLAALAPANVAVTLPKFKFSGAFALAKTLKALDMTRAFVLSDADFSGMDGTHNLSISEVIHQAVVELDEQGTEAAAATATPTAIAARDQPVSFYADHPFIFLIRDPKSGAILFLGRLNDPTAH